MKSKIISVILILISVFTCSCSSEGYPMTEEESDAIAQYCAYLLMKYDKNENVNEKLMDFKDLQRQNEEEVKQKLKEKQLEEAIKQATASSTSEKADSTDNKKDNNKTQEADEKKDSSAAKTDDKKDTSASDKKNEHSGADDKKSAKSLDELFTGSAADAFEIKYLSSGQCLKYDENDYFTISAPSGKKILYVDFKITNTSDKNIRFTATDYSVDYKLYDKDNNVIAPELAALHNELLYMDETIPKGDSITGVVVFFVEEKSSAFILRAGNTSNGNIYDININ